MSEGVTPGPRRNSAGLARDIEVLELLGSPEATQNGGLGVSRLAQMAGRDKAVVSRVLATLNESDLVERDPDTLTYRLGSRIYALAALTAEATLVRQSRIQLRRIAYETRETAHLCVLRGGNVLTLLSELSPYEFHTTGWEGVTTAAWRTPSGRVLISDLDRAAIGQWYAEHGHDAAIMSAHRPAAVMPSPFAVLPEPAAENARVVDLESLLTEVDRIRRAGFAVSDEELERGVVAVSAPVFDFNDRIVAAINVSAPKARVGGQLDTLARYVARAAREVSAALGRPG